MGFLSRDYCCCAVPLYNIGVYTLFAEQLVIGLTTGVLCLAAPSIDAAAIPSFGAYILAIPCILVALFQAFGFWGVFKEKPAAYKKYTLINALLVSLCFLISLAWIILSAVKHQDAKRACLAEFLGAGASTAGIALDTSDTSGDKICDIFMWVQLGIMGFLWFFFLAVQMYLVAVSRIYSSEQKSDHAKYNSIYSAAGLEARNSNIWDARASTSTLEDTNAQRPFIGHNRNDSNMSKSSSLRNEMSPEKGSAAYYQDAPGNYSEEMKNDVYGSYSSAREDQYASPVRSQQQQGSDYYQRQSPTKPQSSDYYHQPSPVKSQPGGSQAGGSYYQQTSPVYTSPTYQQSPAKTSPVYSQHQQSYYGQGQQHQQGQAQQYSPHYSEPRSATSSYPPQPASTTRYQQQTSPTYADPYAHYQSSSPR